MPEAHRKLIKEWADTWSAPSKQDFLDVFAEHCIYEDVAAGKVMIGKLELGDFFDLIRKALPDFKVIDDSIKLGGFGGVIQWHMTGTHLGELFGNAPTEKSILIRGVCVVNIESDKITECTDYYNMATLYSQLGFKSD